MAKKVVKRNLVDQVCEFIRDSIINGDYRPGDKLPSENDLAEEYGTSRLTVRLAIQKLNAMELLETRVGEGSYVKDFNFQQYIDNISSLIFSPSMMGDIKDFRLHVETGFTVLAAHNRTEEELAELAVLCEAFEALYNQDESGDSEALWTALAEKDFEIHMKICEMSHNELFRLTYMTMKNLMVDYMREIIRTRKDRYKQNQEQGKFVASLSTHRKLYEALRLQDEAACRSVLESMVNYEILMPDSYL